jgi:hypothetical protein
MTISGYYLNIPVQQWDSYLRHIIVGIYGIEENQYKVVRESGGIKTVEFSTNGQIPLINSLPRTTIGTMDRVYFKDKARLNAISLAIMHAAKDELTSNGVYYVDAIPIKLTPEEVPAAIYQLTRDKILSKFANLGNNKFIIVIPLYQLPMILQSVDNNLYVTTYSILSSPFDVDDGYHSLLSPLNISWRKWREIGDITVPIHPNNFV